MNAVAYVVMESPENLRQFCQSARSLRSQGFSGAVVAITDLANASWPSDFEYQIVVVPSSPPLFEVSRVYRRLESEGFGHVLKLDTDTLVIAPIERIWEIDGSVVVRRSVHQTMGQKAKSWKPRDDRNATWPDHMRLSALDMKLTASQVPFEKPFYHSGVFLFRYTRAASRLFCEWEQQIVMCPGSNDERSLVRAAERTGIWPTDLPWRFNAHPLRRKSVAECQEAGDVILHFYGAQAKKLLYNWMQ